MRKEDRILRQVFPDRDTFTDDERRIASFAAARIDEEVKKSRLPRTFVPVGGRVRHEGVLYECVVAVDVWPVRRACEGCDCKGVNPDGSKRHCYGLQCHKHDRADGRNVWFKEIEEDNP